MMITFDAAKAIVEELATQQAASQAAHHHRQKIRQDTQFTLRIKAQMRKTLDDLAFQLFWDEKINEEALRLYAQSKKDKEAELLSMALAQHNLIVANQLLQAGVRPTEAQCAQLSFALESRSSSTAKSTRAKTSFHPLKRYGLTLGIVTTVNGVYSQFSHMEQPFNLLQTQLNQYAVNLGSKHPLKNEFVEIAAAYRFANAAIHFNGSKPSSLATKQMHQRFQSGQITVVPCGWRNHAISVTLVDGHLVLTNRGEGGDKTFGTQIYKIAHPEKVNEAFFKTLLEGIATRQAPSVILNTIGEVVDARPVLKIKTTAQKRENCSYANPKSNIKGILAVLAAKAQKVELKASNAQIQALLPRIDAGYKEMTDSVRRDLMNELMNDYQNAAGSEKQQYLTLMNEYVKQHSGRNAKAIDSELVHSIQNFLSLEIKPSRNIIFSKNVQTCQKSVALENHHDGLDMFQSPRLVM